MSVYGWWCGCGFVLHGVVSSVEEFWTVGFGSKQVLVLELEVDQYCELHIDIVDPRLPLLLPLVFADADCCLVGGWWFVVAKLVSWLILFFVFVLVIVCCWFFVCLEGYLFKVGWLFLGFCVVFG